MRPSIASEKFAALVQAPDPIAAIRGLVNFSPPTYEDDWFDCKAEPDDIRDPKQRDRKLKEMWLQALSGFANNSGGVLVWGLDARKDSKTNVDMVRGEKPVSDPFGLKSKLNEWRRQGTDPPLGNVQVEPFEYPPGSGRGFVVCHIPEGPFKPYRTNEGDRSQYYLRSSDNFVVMSTAILRALFHPRPTAIFQFRGRYSWTLDTDVARRGDTASVRLDLLLGNKGTGTGRNLVVVLDPKGEGAMRGFSFVPDDRWKRTGKFVAEQDSFHPGIFTSRLGGFGWKTPTVSSSETGHLVVPDFFTRLFVSCAVYCENQLPQAFLLDVDCRGMTEERKSYEVEAEAIASE